MSDVRKPISGRKAIGGPLDQPSQMHVPGDRELESVGVSFVHSPTRLTFYAGNPCAGCSQQSGGEDSRHASQSDQLVEIAVVMSRNLEYIGSTHLTGSPASSSRNANERSHELMDFRGRSRSQPGSVIRAPPSAAAGPVEPIIASTTYPAVSPIGRPPQPPAPSMTQLGVIFATGVIRSYGRFHDPDVGR
jgi:hypothetical protein